MTDDEAIQHQAEDRSRLMAENRKLKAIIRSALEALDHGFLISARDLTDLREAVK